MITNSQERIKQLEAEKKELEDKRKIDLQSIAKLRQEVKDLKEFSNGYIDDYHEIKELYDQEKAENEELKKMVEQKGERECTAEQAMKEMREAHEELLLRKNNEINELRAAISNMNGHSLEDEVLKVSID